MKRRIDDTSFRWKTLEKKIRKSTLLDENNKLKVYVSERQLKGYANELVECAEEIKRTFRYVSVREGTYDINDPDECKVFSSNIFLL